VPIYATLQSALTVVETITNNGAFLSSSSNKVTHNGLNVQSSIDATTTPPATKVAGFQKALAAGVGTIDLTALPGTNGTTVDGTGLKVQAVKFRNPSSNANNITITVGASNGYQLHGAGWSITLRPGESYLWEGVDAAPDVGGSAKNIDLAGTLVQALDVLIVLG
jgi:hypothetical protein